VRVVVPASSANLGPAFDCGGLALDVCDEYVAMVSDDAGVLIEVSGEGAGDVPLDATHLVARSMALAFAAMDAQPPGGAQTRSRTGAAWDPRQRRSSADSSSGARW
jgi:homoserine kinase